jgi:hypothetical protein
MLPATPVLRHLSVILLRGIAAFNLNRVKRWHQLLADPELARLPYRVETDRHGHILMSPPPAPAHGKKQNWIGTLFGGPCTKGRDDPGSIPA